MTAAIHSMSDLLAALRARRDELQLTHEVIDDVAGWPSGYCGKLLAPNPIKNLGWQSLGLALDTLAIELLVVENTEQRKLVERRWKKRERPHNGSASLNLGKRTDRPDKSQPTGICALMQKLGRIGGKASGKKRRAKAMKKRKLQRVRSHAARLRWAK